MPKTVSLTPQEQDAFDYFHGTGVYKDYQNPKTFPVNIIPKYFFILLIEQIFIPRIKFHSFIFFKDLPR